MAITDAERHRLHTKLDQVLGEEDAAVLISHLPPSGWSDVARTRDLDQLEERMNARFAAVDARFTAVDARFTSLEERMDLRFDAMEARFDARFERGLREQSNRFLLTIGALLTLVAGIQALTTQLIAG